MFKNQSSQCLQAFHTRWSHRKRYLQLGMWVDISFAEVVVDGSGWYFYILLMFSERRAHLPMYTSHPKQCL